MNRNIKTFPWGNKKVRSNRILHSSYVGLLNFRGEVIGNTFREELDFRVTGSTTSEIKSGDFTTLGSYSVIKSKIT